MGKNIVITGEGIVSAIGLDKTSVLDSLRNNKSGIGKLHYLDTVHKDKLPCGEVKLSNEEMKKSCCLTTDHDISRTALMGIMTVKQALEDAGIDNNIKTTNPNLRILLISGTTVGGMDVTERYYNDFITSDKHLEYLNEHDCGSNTSLIADYFGIFTDKTTISTACSSALNAIILGAELLKTGQADIIVAGGTEALTKFHLNGFNSLMILDKEQCRPFDATRAGLNLGEGAGFVVMETEKSAQERNVSIHSYLSGYGNACDAFHQTASSKNGEGAYLAMQKALSMAHLLPSDIQYINAHGTGTPNNDQSESEAIVRIFNDNIPLVSSTKGFTGHTTSASGGIETVISILALQNKFVPGNIGWHNAMPDGIIPTLGKEHYELHNIVCNSFGFGGNDSSIILSDRSASSHNDLSENCTTYDGSSTEGNEYLSNINLYSDNNYNNDNDIKVISKVEITSVEQLAEIRKYLKPLEIRRMGKLMKASLLSSFKALEQAGIETPDAIITGTAMGCIENSEQLLRQITNEGETFLKPTLFMQSTHNTIGSNIAIQTKCHGYNITYSNGAKSLEWAIRDAKMQLRSGKVKNVLVGCHDETTEEYRALMHRIGHDNLPEIESVAMVLTRTDKPI